MNKRNLEEFTAMMAFLHEMIIPDKPPPSRLKVKAYFEALSSYPMDEVKRAFNQVVSRKKIATFPLLGEILEAIGGGQDDDLDVEAQLAFREVCRLAETAGFDEPRSADKVTQRAAEIAFGGIGKFGQMPIEDESYNRHLFIKTYKQVKRDGLYLLNKYDAESYRELKASLKTSSGQICQLRESKGE